MLPHHRRNGGVGGGSVFDVVPYPGPSPTVTFVHLIDHHPKKFNAEDRSNSTPSDQSEAILALKYESPHLTTSAHPPHIPHPGRPPPSRRGSSAISSLVVVIISTVVFIGGGSCLINCGKVAVIHEDWLQGVVVAVPLKGRSGRRQQVSSVPV